MDRIRHKFDVRVSAPATGVLTEGFFKCKPLEQQAKVVNRSVIRRFHMTRTLLNVTVVSESKKKNDCKFLFWKRQKRGKMGVPLKLKVVCHSHITEIHTPFKKLRTACQRALWRYYQLHSIGGNTMTTNGPESTQGETTSFTNATRAFEQRKYSYLARQLANADSETWYGDRNIKFKQIWTSLITPVRCEESPSFPKLNSMQKPSLLTPNRYTSTNRVLQTSRSALNNFYSFQGVENAGGSYLSHQKNSRNLVQSLTFEPQIGNRPLHLVFAFWRAALSHSSRPRASLIRKNLT